MYRAQNYRPRALGFTAEEEKRLLEHEVSEGKKLDELLSILQKQDQVRTITVVATVLGLLYTLTQIEDLIKKRRGII